MKKLLTLLALTVMSHAHAQLTNGLIAHWDFSGTANDISGNGLNGTANNVIYTSGKNGTANTAAEFNGYSSKINVPYNNLMNANAMSICAVVNFRDFYAGLCQMSIILQRGSFFMPGSYSLSIYDNAYDNDCQKVSLDSFVFHQKTNTVENAYSGSSLRYSPTIKKNQWYTVVSTYDGFNTRIYVDGVQMVTYTSSVAKGTSTEGISIGANDIVDVQKFPYWLNGKIDDLRMYNRALTPTEVTEYSKLFDSSIYITNINSPHSCPGDTLLLDYTTSSKFQSGNVFTAQLSDLSGSFNNPISLGSLASDTDGTIQCIIPHGLLPGTGSNIRIVSTAPNKVSSNLEPLKLYDKQPPVISITATPQGATYPGQTITYTAQIGNAGDNPIIKWYKNHVWIPNVNGNTFLTNSMVANDTVYAEVISSNPCTPNATTKSNEIRVYYTSINDSYFQTLKLYPNPNQGSFIIEATGIQHSSVSISVFNMIGQSILSKNIDLKNKAILEHLDMNAVTDGVYILHISSGDQQRNIRFTINR